MDYTQAQKALTQISRKQKRHFTQQDILLLNELKKSPVNKIKSWSTELLPSPKTKKLKIPRMFKRLGQGSSAVQYSIQLEKGLL